MKPSFTLGLAALACALMFPSGLPAQQNPSSQPRILTCRPLPEGSNIYVESDEQIVGNQICKAVASTSSVAPAPQPVAVPDTAPSVKPAPKPCLIVASAEGHRFRDSMIAGALTGGVGFVGGALVGGAKYAYRDSFNVPSNEVKMKYKGNELQKIERDGVHVEIVDAKDKSGSQIDAARKSCQEQ